MSNEGVIEKNEERGEGVQNKLSIDISQKDEAFYPLVIHSTGTKSKDKVNKGFWFTYKVDKNEYGIPK